MITKGEGKKMKDLVISEVQITPVKPKEGLVAFASCVINNQLYIGNIAIYTRPDGNDFRLAYPTKTLPNGKQINCVHPINRQTGEILRKRIVDQKGSGGKPQGQNHFSQSSHKLASEALQQTSEYD